MRQSSIETHFGSEQLKTLEREPVHSFLMRWVQAKSTSYETRCSFMNGVDRPDYNRRNERFTAQHFSRKLSRTLENDVEKHSYTKHCDRVRVTITRLVTKIGSQRIRSNLHGILYLLSQAMGATRSQETSFAFAYATVHTFWPQSYTEHDRQRYYLIFLMYTSYYLSCLYSGGNITDRYHTSAHMCVMSAQVHFMFMDFEKNEFWHEDADGLLPAESALLILMDEPCYRTVLVFIIACMHMGIINPVLLPPDWDSELVDRVNNLRDVLDGIFKEGTIYFTEKTLERFKSFHNIVRTGPRKSIFKNVAPNLAAVLKKMWYTDFEQGVNRLLDPRDYILPLLTPGTQCFVVLMGEISRTYDLPSVSDDRLNTIQFHRADLHFQQVRDGHAMKRVYLTDGAYAEYSQIVECFRDKFIGAKLMAPDTFTTAPAYISYLIYKNGLAFHNILDLHEAVMAARKKYAGNLVRCTRNLKRDRDDNTDSFCFGDRKRTKLSQLRFALQCQ